MVLPAGVAIALAAAEAIAPDAVRAVPSGIRIGLLRDFIDREGFGSLAWSSNAGLASLDLVCAGGVLCVLFTSLVFLPRLVLFQFLPVTTYVSGVAVEREWHFRTTWAEKGEGEMWYSRSCSGGKSCTMR